MVRKLQGLGREGTHRLRHKKGRRRIRRELQRQKGWEAASNWKRVYKADVIRK